MSFYVEDSQHCAKQGGDLLSLATLLKELLSERGMQAEDLASPMVPGAYVRAVEKGEAIPQAQVLVAWAKALGVQLSVFGTSYRVLCPPDRELLLFAIALADAGQVSEAEPFLAGFNVCDLGAIELGYSLAAEAAIARERGREQVASSLLTQALDAARRSQDAYLFVSVYAGLTRLNWKQHDLGAAEIHLRQGLTHSRSLEFPESLIWQRHFVQGLASLLGRQGRYDEAICAYSQLKDLAKQSGDITAQAMAFWGLATSYTYVERFVEALQAYERALILFDSLDAHKNCASLLNNRGILYAKMGYDRLAEKDLRTSLKLKNDLGLTIEKLYTLNELAALCERRNQLEDAQEYVEQALAIASVTEDFIEVSATYCLAAKVAWRNDALQSAADYLVLTEELLRKKGLLRHSAVLAHYLEVLTYFSASADFTRLSEALQRTIAITKEILTEEREKAQLAV